MPFAERDGTRLYWRLDGDDEAPPLLLIHAIGGDMAVWDACIPLLRVRFRIVRVDLRGHGASDAPAGPYSLAMLADDVAAVMDAAGIARAAVAGVSLGGMIALQMALNMPDRVARAVPICTGISFDRSLWDARIDAALREGMAPATDALLPRFLAPSFIARAPAAAAMVRRTIRDTSAQGYAGAAAAIRDMDLADRLGAIAVPVLIVSGTDDIAAPATEHGEVATRAIAGARHVAVAAAHLPPVENPAGLVAAIVPFLEATDAAGPAGTASYDAGLANRRRVLGDAWVDRALAGRTAFNADFQAVITRTAWHEIWGRPGLEDRFRRLLVIAITGALGCWEEFQLHVRAGLTHGGFTPDELKEVLLQLAVYAGVPAANTAFTLAGPIVDGFHAQAAPNT